MIIDTRQLPAQDLDHLVHVIFEVTKALREVTASTSGPRLTISRQIDQGSVGNRNAAFAISHGRRDKCCHGSPTPIPMTHDKKTCTRDFDVRDLDIGPSKVKTHVFR